MSATRSRGDRTDREILLVVCLSGLAVAILELVHTSSLVAAGGLLTLAISLGVVLLRHNRSSPPDTLTMSELEILGHTSHQLRSPLTIARGHAELLLRAARGTDSEVHAEIILQELDRAARLSERMLVLAPAPRAATARGAPLPIVVRLPADGALPAATS